MRNNRSRIAVKKPKVVLEIGETYIIDDKKYYIIDKSSYEIYGYLINDLGEKEGRKRIIGNFQGKQVVKTS